MSVDSNNNIKNTVEAVTGLIKAIPIYEDALQPAAKEVGKALGTLAKTIHIALAPISSLIWGYDQVKEFVTIRMAEKLKNVAEDQICTPNPNVAGPTLEALKYTGHDETLREMYANLLATSLNLSTTSMAHPAFVEVIKQLSPGEARLIQSLSTVKTYPTICECQKSTASKSAMFSFEVNVCKQNNDIKLQFFNICKHILNLTTDEAFTYLDNLKRLQIVEIDESNSQIVHDSTSRLPQGKIKISPIKIIQRQSQILKFTIFGERFVHACVIDRT